MNNDPCKAFKNIWFWDKEIKKQTKFVTHMNLWKYGQILTIRKSLIIIRLKFSNKDECCFSSLTFLNSKLQATLNPHWPLVVGKYNQKFFT
jgi:hypothetical protein